MIKIIPYTYYR